MIGRLSSRELFTAIQNNESNKISAFLIKGSIDLSVKDNDDCTPIHYAAKLQHWDCVKLLLQYPINKEDSVKFGLGAALYYAIAYKRGDCIKKLLDAGAATQKVYDSKKGFSALHTAIESNHIPLLKLLLDQKTDPSEKSALTKENTDQVTPLELAVKERNRQKTIALLLDAKADTTDKNAKGYIPIEQAAILNHWEYVKQFLHHSHKKDPLCLHYVLRLAVYEKENDCAEMLIKQGAKLNGAYNKRTGFSILHQAIVDGNIEIVRSLILAKADPFATTKMTTQNSEPKTALQLAIQYEKKEISHFLEEKYEIPEKIIKENFYNVASFMEVYNKLQELLKEHTLEKILSLSNIFSEDYSTNHFFKLGCLVLLLKQKKEQFNPLENIEIFFKNVPHECHVYIARAFLEAIQKTFESNKKLDLTLKKEIRELLKTKTIANTQTMILPTELHKLKLIEEKYCYQISNKIYSNKNESFLRDKILQIAASKYLHDRLQNSNILDISIKDTLILLFGKNILRRFFKKSSLSHFLDEMIPLNNTTSPPASNVLKSSQNTYQKIYPILTSDNTNYLLKTPLLQPIQIAAKEESTEMKTTVTTSELIEPINSTASHLQSLQPMQKQQIEMATVTPISTKLIAPTLSNSQALNSIEQLEIEPTVMDLSTEATVSSISIYKKPQKNIDPDTGNTNKRSLIL